MIKWRYILTTFIRIAEGAKTALKKAQKKGLGVKTYAVFGNGVEEGIEYVNGYANIVAMMCPKELQLTASFTLSF